MQEEQVQARTSGWVVFAAVLMVMAGIFGMINGLIALIDDQIFIVTEEHIWALDTTTWGWIHLILGALVFFAGLAVTSGVLWARLVGILAVMVHAITQVAFIEAFPFWTLAIMTLDFIVIYALIVHSEEKAGGGEGGTY